MSTLVVIFGVCLGVWILFAILRAIARSETAKGILVCLAVVGILLWCYGVYDKNRHAEVQQAAEDEACKHLDPRTPLLNSLQCQGYIPASLMPPRQ